LLMNKAHEQSKGSAYEMHNRLFSIDSLPESQAELDSHGVTAVPVSANPSMMSYYNDNESVELSDTETSEHV